jgi:hypothetical protein
MSYICENDSRRSSPDIELKKQIMELTDNTTPGNYSPMNFTYRKENLPNSVSALVFGIVSLATMAYCGWIMAIIALNHAKKAKLIAEQNPGRYSDSSLRMANAGRIMGIIGVVAGIVCTFLWVLYFIFIFTLITSTSHHHMYYSY